MNPKILLFVAFASAVLDFSDANCKDGTLEHGVSPDEENMIVDLHNQIRRSVSCGQIDNQPKGINLKKIQYSRVLAIKAQEIASKCLFNPPPISGTQFEYVGRNSFMRLSSALKYGAEWNLTMQDWKAEHKKFVFGQASANLKGGLYTQLVWADTTSVGCGYALYVDERAKYKYNKLYICAYGPAGNIIGEFPYVVDRSGTKRCNPLV